MASAANGGGTKITLAFAPVSSDGPIDGVEDRDALVVLAALARRDPGDHVGAALQHPPRVESALPAGYALYEEPRPIVYEYSHPSTAPRH